MSDKSFRFDWYAKDAHTDFMELTAEEIGVLMQICNLMYIKNGPIENDPKWIARSISEMGIAKCRNVINSLEKKGHIFIEKSGKNSEKIRKKMVENQIEIVKKRRKTPQNSEKYESENEQKQQDTDLLETETETAPVVAPVISKVLEELPQLNEVVFCQFLEHRNHIGKPVHKNFVKDVVEDLKKLVHDGEDPNLVIKQSIKNGWTSLQPTKKGQKNGKSKSQSRDLAEQARELLDKYADPQPHQSDDSLL